MAVHGDEKSYQHLYPDIWAAMKQQYGRRASVPPDVWTMFQDLQLLKFAKEDSEILNVVWGLQAFSKAAKTNEGRRAAFVAKVLVQELPAKEHEAWFLLCKQTGELDNILTTHPDPASVVALGNDAAKTSVAVSVILEDVRRRWEGLHLWQRDIFYAQLNAFLSSKLREAALIVDVLEPSTFTFLFTKQLVRAGHRELALSIFRKTPPEDLFKTVQFGEPLKDHSYFELHTRFLMHGGGSEATQVLEHLVEIGAYSDKSLDVFIHNVDLKDALLFVIDVVSCIRLKHSSKADQKALQKLLAEQPLGEKVGGQFSSDEEMEGQATYKPPPKPSRCFCFGRTAKAQAGAARLLWAAGVPHELLRELLQMYANRDPSAQDYLLHQKDFQQAIEVVLLLSNSKQLVRFVERFGEFHQEALRACMKEWARLHLIKLLEANRPPFYKPDEAAALVHGFEQWTWKSTDSRSNYFATDKRSSQDLAMVLSTFMGLTMFLDVALVGQFITWAAGRDRPVHVLEEFIPSDSHFFLALAREVSHRMTNLYLPEVKMLMRSPGFFDYGVQGFLVGRSMDLPREVFRENMGFALLMQTIARLVSFHGGHVPEEKLEHSVYQISTACQGNPFCLNLMLRVFVSVLKKPALDFLPAGADDATSEPSAFTVIGLAACARRLREACDTVRNETVKQTLTRLVDAFLDTPPRSWSGMFNALETVLFFLRLKEKEDLQLAYTQFEAENKQAFKEDPEMRELMREAMAFFMRPFMDVSSVTDLCTVDVRTVMAKHKFDLGPEEEEEEESTNVDSKQVDDTEGASSPSEQPKASPRRNEDGEADASKKDKEESTSPQSVVLDVDPQVETKDNGEKSVDKGGAQDTDKPESSTEDKPEKDPKKQSDAVAHSPSGSRLPSKASKGHGEAYAKPKEDDIPRGLQPKDWNTIVEIATCTAESMKEKCNVPMLPHHTQMITLLMLAVQVCRGPGKKTGNGNSSSAVPDSTKTVLARVGTGEGKSWLIGMLSSFVAKKGLRAHVIVDNPTLLERDFASMQPLFQKLGLSAGKREFNNGHQIIYCSGMDLEWDYMEKVKNGEDANFRHACMIVDEVDSLIVDDSVYKCYVDEYREGSDCCNKWCNEGRQGFPNAERWETKIIDRLEGAYNEMRNKRDGRDFFVDHSQNWIWALDANTMQVLRSAWFLWLELKRKQMMQSYTIRYMTRQSIVCKRSCFSSHRFIFGLTGSLGTEAEMKYTKTNFGASHFIVPPFLNTCRGERVSKARCVATNVEPNPDAQADHTVQVARNYSFSVPVVIVCRDAERVERIVWALREALPSHAEGDRNGEGIVHLVETPGQEAEFQQMVERATLPLEVPSPDDGKPLQYWRVTVTTPVGARGQDYRISDELVDEKGGLMLILEFIPHSEREWIQFLGRTARHDHPGQYAVILNLEEYKHVLGQNVETASEGGTTKRILDHINKEGEKKLQSTQQEIVRGAIMHKFTAKWWAWSEKHKLEVNVRREKFDKWVTLCEDFETMKPDQIVRSFAELQIESEDEEEGSEEEDDEEEGQDTQGPGVPGEANMRSLIDDSNSPVASTAGQAPKAVQAAASETAAGRTLEQLLQMGQRFMGTGAAAAPSAQPARSTNSSAAPPPPPMASPSRPAPGPSDNRPMPDAMPALPDDPDEDFYSREEERRHLAI